MTSLLTHLATLLRPRTMALATAAAAALLPMQVGAAPTTPAAFSVIHAFDLFLTNPWLPSSPLRELPDGSFYGTTFAGGKFEAGTMYRLTRDHVISDVHDAGGFDMRPHGQTVRIGSSVFGVTGLPSARAACGTVYRIDKDLNFESLHHLDFGPGGCYPNGLTLGPDGALYGTATGEIPTAGMLGGVFRITAGGDYSVVYDFRSQGGGASPRAELLLASDGNFYGTTVDSVFRLTPQGVLTTLFTFSARPELGYSPYGSLIQASDGRLYGTTKGDAATDKPSTVYRTTLDGQSEWVTNLDATTVGRAYSGLVQARDRHLYGLTVSERPGDAATVFRLTLAGRLSVLHRFDSALDGMPSTTNSPLIQARDGQLYGVTGSGGPNGGGTIFTVSPRGPVH